MGWEDADLPLPAGNWPLIAPSAHCLGPHNQVPRAMTLADMAAVRGAIRAGGAVGC